eukprot:CAMPEP_0203992002 /NCGR_PEP_ID=MMETSP0360-20130528/9799_1 /ASSEMBLY_ACC=CAM_ASM_000342 /TAXON_ID=268821 /ORGANISM="Scrippsiella Hangoei, Strain SHTV-5" /LENGTH=210 /DNA_ID=CAMNT_0050932249 /DNA_START=141 /DNA_END=771 /DNA_ORIENTATION=+
MDTSCPLACSSAFSFSNTSKSPPPHFLASFPGTRDHLLEQRVGEETLVVIAPVDSHCVLPRSLYLARPHIFADVFLPELFLAREFVPHGGAAAAQAHGPCKRRHRNDSFITWERHPDPIFLSVVDHLGNLMCGQLPLHNALNISGDLQQHPPRGPGAGCGKRKHCMRPRQQRVNRQPVEARDPEGLRETLGAVRGLALAPRSGLLHSRED